MLFYFKKIILIIVLLLHIGLNNKNYLRLRTMQIIILLFLSIIKVINFNNKMINFCLYM